MSKDSIPFRIFQINTEEFATIEKNLDSGNGEITVSTGLNFAIDSEAQAVKCTLRAIFSANENDFLIIQASCEFVIKPEAWNDMINSKKNVLTINKSFATHLAFLTIGTVRGILHSKTENTIFNQFLLPTLNVNEMVNENIKIDLL